MIIKRKFQNKMKTMMAMTCSIMIMVVMMMSVAILINWLEGDILPDTSPWSFVEFQEQKQEIRNEIQS